MNSPDPSQATRAPGTGGAADGACAADSPGFWPQQAAIALAYGRDDAAPRVLAKGRGLVAQAIIERAKEHGVYVHESKEMVSLLMQVDLDQRIPPELYRAVAELLVWVYRLEQEGTEPGAAAAGGDLSRREKS